MDLKHWTTSAGRLNSEDAVGWALRLAKTVAVLHRRGLAHGRISLNAVQSDGPECDTEAALRPASRLVEDEAYLSSERLTGAAPTPADDVWAIGVVLYRTLTGELPFVDTAVSGQQPVALVQAVGAELAAIQPVFDRVFHRDRAERIVTAHDLVVVLSGHHPRAGELEALELPTESIALAHRVRHVSQPLLEAVRQEQDALPALLGQAGAGEGEEELDEDEPRRDSEAGFLGWLSEPPPASDEETPEPAESAAAPSDEPSSEHDELYDDWDDDDDDRPTLMMPLAPSLEPPDSDPGEPEPGDDAAAPDEGGAPAPPPPSPPDPSPEVAVASAPARDEAPVAAPAVEPPEAPAQRSTPRPTQRRSRPVALWLVAAGLGALVVVLGVLRMRGDPPSDPSARRTTPSAAATQPAARQSGQPPPTAEPSGAVPPLTAASSTTPSLPVSATASPSAAPVETSSPVSRPAVGDRDACMRALFAADTFSSDATPSFDRVCRRGHPRKGAEAIKGLVVAGGSRRPVTMGMKQWAVLGWYSMAAFTVIHGYCCDSAIDLSHASFKICGLGDALAALHAAARGRPGELDGATEAYQKAASCTWQSNNAKMFQQTTQPTLQQLASYRKILERMTR